MISSKSAFNPVINVLYKKAIRAMFALHSATNKSKQTSPKIPLDFFDKMIVPIVSYNCEIWGAYPFKEKRFNGKSKDSIFELHFLEEDLHMKYMEITLGVNSKACDLAVRSESGRYPLHMNIFTAVPKY